MAVLKSSVFENESKKLLSVSSECIVVGALAIASNVRTCSSTETGSNMDAAANTTLYSSSTAAAAAASLGGSRHAERR